MEPIVYNEEKQKEIANECKKNYQKAINILLYNNKPKSSPEVLSLKN